ncbi:MAG: hypothetical protein Q8L55_09850, partial [Phycisphaerales bacterium]|nr:hypothetical protein [Phycisphaerales bacterium]
MHRCVLASLTVAFALFSGCASMQTATAPSAPAPAPASASASIIPNSFNTTTVFTGDGAPAAWSEVIAQ